MATRIAPSPADDPTTCAYCQQAYTPRRRWVQKYCTSACRVAASNARTGRAHPLEAKKVRARRRAQGLGRTPSAVTTGPGGGLSFPATALAAGMGALGANTLTQTAEYVLVTQQLLAEMQQLRQAVAQVAARQQVAERGQSEDNKVLANGLYKVLRTLGLAPREAEQALRLPAAVPPVVAPAARANTPPPAVAPHKAAAAKKAPLPPQGSPADEPST